MSDCGHHHHHHHHENTDFKRLLAALFITVFIMVIEVVGGVISSSLALIADAAHMSTDAMALGLAGGAHWFSKKPANDSLHFGYRRIQVLAAFVNSILLFILIGWIVIEAIQRFLNPEPVIWSTMLVVAILGLASNGIAFAILTYGNKSNVNIRGAVLHVLSDLLGSAAAVLAALVIMATGWLRVDPILSVLVALLIGRSAYHLLKDTGHILLEGAPTDINVPALISALKERAPEIADIHKVQIWQLTPEHPRLTMHVAVNRSDTAAGTLTRIKSFLDEHYSSLQSTIQIEIKNHCPDLLCNGSGKDMLEGHIAPSGLAADSTRTAGAGDKISENPRDTGTTIH